MQHASSEKISQEYRTENHWEVELCFCFNSNHSGMQTNDILHIRQQMQPEANLPVQVDTSVSVYITGCGIAQTRLYSNCQWRQQFNELWHYCPQNDPTREASVEIWTNDSRYERAFKELEPIRMVITTCITAMAILHLVHLSNEDHAFSKAAVSSDMSWTWMHEPKDNRIEFNTVHPLMFLPFIKLLGLTNLDTLDRVSSENSTSSSLWLLGERLLNRPASSAST